MNKIEHLESLKGISADEWNSCVSTDQPFAKHEFLLALEESGSAAPKSGWLAQHIVIRDSTGAIKGCVPLYLKSHSYGEYVFDWSWAEAYERAGGRYYPKLQAAIPFTPATGARFLMHETATETDQRALIQACIKRAQELRISSLHITFCPKTQWDLCKDEGLLSRSGHQFHWINKDYNDFEDFLGDFSSRKRKNLKKERKKVQESGITFDILSGSDITETHWDYFYAFYQDTSSRKWGQAYLNREFYSLIGQTMADDIVLVLAKLDDQVVAGALNFKGSETLYGRYWGCLDDFKFLHFETCYYQAIEYAIAHNLKRVEAGAQGQHKIQRGYLPVKTYSAHWINDAGFERAVKDYLVNEQRMNDLEIQELSKFSPYKAAE